ATVVLVLFSDSNLQTAKRRPALVIQADNLETGLPQSIVAMITSNTSRAGHASRVTLPLNSEEGRQARILMDSVVMTDNLTTVHEKEYHRALSSLSDINKIDTALRHTLSLQ